MKITHYISIDPTAPVVKFTSRGASVYVGAPIYWLGKKEFLGKLEVKINYALCKAIYWVTKKLRG